MVNLFFVEAPFQLLSALEASKALEHNILVLRKNGSSRNNEQINNILKINQNSWRFIVRVDARQRIKSFLILLLLKLYILVLCGTLNVVAIGDYRSKFIQFFYPWFRGKRLWLLDDGIGLITLCKYENGNFVLDAKKLQSKNFKIGNDYLKHAKSSDSIELHTFLELSESVPFSVHNVNLNATFLAYMKPNQEIDQDLIYFIGSKVEEDGLLSREKYLDLCGRVKASFPLKRILYFPHRDEFDSSVNEIETAFGFSIVRPNLPIEFYLCNQQKIPSSVVGLFSTALFTISDMYPIIRAYTMECEFDVADSELKEILKTCYGYLKFKKMAISI